MKYGLYIVLFPLLVIMSFSCSDKETANEPDDCIDNKVKVYLDIDSEIYVFPPNNTSFVTGVVNVNKSWREYIFDYIDEGYEYSGDASLECNAPITVSFISDACFFPDDQLIKGNPLRDTILYMYNAQVYGHIGHRKDWGLYGLDRWGDRQGGDGLTPRKVDWTGLYGFTLWINKQSVCGLRVGDPISKIESTWGIKVSPRVNKIKMIVPGPGGDIDRKAYRNTLMNTPVYDKAVVDKWSNSISFQLIIENQKIINIRELIPSLTPFEMEEGVRYVFL